MRIMLISDLQAHNWAAYPETDKRGVNLRLLDTVQELKRLLDLCIQNGVAKFAVLGDIFQARSNLQVSVLNAVYESFYNFYAAGIEVILLVGNHDRTSVGGEHALKVFKSFATVIDRPMTLPLEDGETMVGIPFHPNPKVIASAIKKSVTPDTKLLLLHCAINGLQLHTGSTWKDEGIEPSDIPEHCITLLGHYHRWTEVRQGKVWYIGSMGHVDFGDAGSEKFFAVYNSKRHRVQFHHTQGPKFVNLELSRREAHNHPPVDRPLVPADLDLEKSLNLIAGNFVRVQYLPPGFTDLQGLQVVLKSLQARYVTFDLQVASTPPVEEEDEDAQEWSTMPVREMLERYVAAHPAAENVPVDTLLAKGHAVLDAAMQPDAPEVDLHTLLTQLPIPAKEDLPDAIDDLTDDELLDQMDKGQV